MPPKHRAPHSPLRLRSALVTATTGPLALAALGALCAPAAQAAPTTVPATVPAAVPTAVPAADATPAARDDAGYTVVAGDTLSTIAAAHQSTVAALADANHLASPDVLAVGQHLDLVADDASASRSGRHAAADTAAAPHAATSGVVGTARTWIGTAYEWGGNTRSGVDCSGLTSQVFSANGTSLPRTADAQMNASKRISRDQARPGDLVFGVNSDGTAHHVGIYLGNGQQIDAPEAGETVGVHKLYRDQTVFGRVA
jgi:cell wall-associated NlpC family hydrolase